MDWNEIDRIWFLTWTTYGTWLPGDERGFVSPKFAGDNPERRNNEPGLPYDEGRADLRRVSENKLAGEPVRLDPRSGGGGPSAVRGDSEPPGLAAPGGSNHGESCSPRGRRPG